LAKKEAKLLPSEVLEVQQVDVRQIYDVAVCLLFIRDVGISEK